MAKNSFTGFMRILSPLYQGKDPAHGVGHIERIYAKALRFSAKRKVDPEAIALGAALHGLIDDNAGPAQGLLLVSGVSAELLEKGMQAALESKAGSVPRSSEGIILHDAHLCEGDESFLAAKWLATAISKGYQLEETFEWVGKNILENKQRGCYLPGAKREYAKKMKHLRTIWKDVGVMLA